MASVSQNVPEAIVRQGMLLIQIMITGRWRGLVGNWAFLSQCVGLFFSSWRFHFPQEMWERYLVWLHFLRQEFWVCKHLFWGTTHILSPNYKGAYSLKKFGEPWLRFFKEYVLPGWDEQNVPGWDEQKQKDLRIGKIGKIGRSQRRRMDEQGKNTD